MAYNSLKSIDPTNFVNVLMCFLVSCTYKQRGPRVTSSDYGVSQDTSVIFLVVCSSKL